MAARHWRTRAGDGLALPQALLVDLRKGPR
jgi:hypothetical protein